MAHKTPEEPETPSCVDHVLEWYFELSGQRRGGFSGADPIGWSEIADWSALTGTAVLPEEVRMIVAMDGAFRQQCRDEQKESKDEKANAGKQAPAARPAPKSTRKPRKT